MADNHSPMENENTKMVVYEFEQLQPTNAETLARAEIDMQISTAKSYPRSLADFTKSAMQMVTMDRATASSCCFVLPKKDQKGNFIEGPSIRLAEILALCYKNLRIAAQIISIDDEYVTARGIVHDLENNVLYSGEIKRSILTKEGKTFGKDMIGVTANAACSIVTRNAIMRVMPRSLWWPIYLAAKKVSVGDEKEFGPRRAQMMKVFEGIGVSADMIFSLLGKKGIEDIDRDDIGALIGIYTGIQEGTISKEEAFPVSSVPIGRPLFGKRSGIAQETSEGAETPLDPSLEIKRAVVDERRAETGIPDDATEENGKTTGKGGKK